MTNVFYTWLGPPQGATKEIDGLDGKHRPDVFGILRTAKASFRNTPPPSFTLCVLQKFKAQFDAELPSFVSTLAVDAAFPTSSYQSLVLTAPKLDDLDMCVDYIMRETLQVRGTGYSTTSLPFGKLAFVKDLWSLYCVWKYGGYHLDSGIFPETASSPLDFPAPTAFCVPTIDNADIRAPARRVRFALRSGKPLTVTISAKASQLEGTAMQGRVTATSEQTHVARLLDVWLMGAPAGDPSARLALEVYVRTWFEIQAWSKANPTGDTKELFRELVVFSALTGVTHTGPQHKAATAREVGERLIGGFNKKVPSMNLRKVGFRTHR